MRIAVIHSHYSSSSPSGENSAVGDQVRELERAGHEVLTIARSTDNEIQKPFYRLRSALSAANLLGPDPSDSLNGFSPDIVHVHNLFPNWGSTWLDRWGDRTVATLHNYRTVCAAGTVFRDGRECFDCPTSGSHNAVRHACYRGSRAASTPLAFASRGAGSHQPILTKSAALITLNPAAHRFFSGISPALVRLIPNFINRPSTIPRRRGKYWSYVGRLSTEKGLKNLLESFPKDQDLAVAGDGPLRRYVEAISAESHGNIQYQGMLDRASAYELIAGSRGLIFPSLMPEGIPTVVLEALSSGTPVVISDSCTSALELTRLNAGVVADIRQPDALACAMSTIDRDYETFQDGARRLHETAYSSYAWLTAVESLYDEVRTGTNCTKFDNR